jgi:hypothetical protein
LASAEGIKQGEPKRRKYRRDHLERKEDGD